MARKMTAKAFDRMMDDRYGKDRSRPRTVVKKPRVLIVVQGGVISSVIADTDIEYVIKDFDDIQDRNGDCDFNPFDVCVAHGRPAEQFDHACMVDLHEDTPKPNWD